ncbi:MAG: hypothetical protein N3A57_00015 [Negativicutes bacterium]|nr:hypothetical protein [Negativicutes bacterium]
MDSTGTIIKYSPAVMPVKPPGRPDGKAIGSNDRTAGNFSDIFAEQLRAVKFSRHASERLRQRGIELDGAMQQKLVQAVDKASAKGAREALILDSDRQLAMLVSITNRTVITAVDGPNIKENVFTNIDSAVIV